MLKLDFFHIAILSVLCREVISRNPFKDRGKWLEISLALPMSVDARRVRERTVLLMEQRRKANSSSLKKYNYRNYNRFCLFNFCLGGGVREVTTHFVM